MNNRNSILRKLIYAIIVLVLLWVAWDGLNNGIRQIPRIESSGQIAQTVFQVGYGLTALLLLYSTFLAKDWSRVIMFLWILCVTSAMGLAPVVWGGAVWTSGVQIGLIGLIISLVVVCLLKASLNDTNRLK